MPTKAATDLAAKDAEKNWFNAQAMRQLCDAGYTLNSVRDAFVKGNLSLLTERVNTKEETHGN